MQRRRTGTGKTCNVKTVFESSTGRNRLIKRYITSNYWSRRFVIFVNGVVVGT